MCDGDGLELREAGAILRLAKQRVSRDLMQSACDGTCVVPLLLLLLLLLLQLLRLFAGTFASWVVQGEVPQPAAYQMFTRHEPWYGYDEKTTQYRYSSFPTDAVLYGSGDEKQGTALAYQLLLPVRDARADAADGDGLLHGHK